MSNLRDFARGQACQLRYPSICLGGTDTTVLAHVRLANVAGIGQKPPDLCGIYACAKCHDVLDRRVPIPVDLQPQLYTLTLLGLLRTLAIVQSNFTLRKSA